MSSVFLLNTKGVLNESLFNALSLVCSMSHNIEGQSFETSRPVLLWLLRDFLLELKDTGGADITATEYLEQCLHARPTEGGSDPQRASSAKEVKDTLLRFFPERHCKTLIQPLIDEEKLQKLQEVSFEELRPEFQSAFQELRTQLFSLVHARPKTVGGQVVGASGLVALLRKFVKSLNEGSVLSVNSAWDQVQRSSCEALSVELQQRALTALRQVREGAPLPIPGGRPLPVSDQELASALKECRRQLRDEWKLYAVGDESVRAEYWKDLKSLLQDEEKALQKLNNELASASLRKAGDDWQQWLAQDSGAQPNDERSQALSSLLMSPLPSEAVSSVAAEALRSARVAFLKQITAREVLQAELAHLRKELEGKAQAVELASREHGEELIRRSLEDGRLQGQVDVLQSQVQEASQREAVLREQISEAMKSEVALREKATQHQNELQKTVQEFQNEVSALTGRISELHEKDLEAQAALNEAKQKGKQPKCTCTVM